MTPDARRILVDTNVWRYLVDSDGIEPLYRAAKSGRAVILACPAVLYEMLRLDDLALQRRLVRAICRARWVRMMPEAFEESMELLAEISRFRPEWMARRPDTAFFYRLKADWSGTRGVWWRARTDPAQAARVLRSIEGDVLSLGRDQAASRRAAMREVTTFETVTLDRWTTVFPLHPPGWNGDPVETWRAETMRYYIGALLMRDGGEQSPQREWLGSWVDLAAVRKDLASFTRLMLYETEVARLPRNWLRWALQTLQATRATSAGTPVDAQIGSYLVDADFFVTADRGFVAIAKRLFSEAIVRIAEPVQVTVDNCLERLVNFFD